MDTWGAGTASRTAVLGVGGMGGSQACLGGQAGGDWQGQTQGPAGPAGIRDPCTHPRDHHFSMAHTAHAPTLLLVPLHPEP